MNTDSIVIANMFFNVLFIVNDSPLGFQNLAAKLYNNSHFCNTNY